MILNCDNSWRDPFKPYLPTLSPYNTISQKYKDLCFGPQNQKSGLRAMPEGIESEAKERQGQNWPGKNLLPYFSMKIKVVPFVFPNHWQSIRINLFFITRGPFNTGNIQWLRTRGWLFLKKIAPSASQTLSTIFILFLFAAKTVLVSW